MKVTLEFTIRGQIEADDEAAILEKAQKILGELTEDLDPFAIVTGKILHEDGSLLAHGVE